jgi:hypothetical protein
VSLSSSAGTGLSAASNSPATVLFPAPGGPATTHTAASGMIGSSRWRRACAYRIP